MLPVIICSHNRFNLLKQSIDSIIKNSDGEIEVIVVDDSEKGEYELIKNYIDTLSKPVKLFHFETKVTIGQAKTKGIELSLDSEYIYIADNDIYYLPHWDTLILKAIQENQDLCIIGGRGVHGGGDPRILDEEHRIGITTLQTGYSMLMRRKEYNEWGQFQNYDEDTWICREMTSRLGKKIGVIDPPIIIHCGLTSQNTIKAFDYNDILESQKKYPDLYYE